MPFVSFEGVDGGGKTTQLGLLGDWLISQNQVVVRTREPGGGGLGKAVRACLTAERTTPLSATEELLLVSAARYDHVRSLIRPALADGAWVLTDRFYDSTFALQVFETGVSENLYEITRQAVVGDTVPNITFVLDLDPSLAAQRRQARGDAGDPAERTRNFERIRAGLHRVVERDPERCRLIDAGQEPEVVAQAIQAHVAPWLPR